MESNKYIKQLESDNDKLRELLSIEQEKNDKWNKHFNTSSCYYLRIQKSFITDNPIIKSHHHLSVIKKCLNEIPDIYKCMNSRKSSVMKLDLVSISSENIVTDIPIIHIKTKEKKITLFESVFRIDRGFEYWNSGLFNVSDNPLAAYMPSVVTDFCDWFISSTKKLEENEPDLSKVFTSTSLKKYKIISEKINKIIDTKK